METLLSGCVQPARAHALPFRTIFEELLQRREVEVLKIAAATLPPAPSGSPMDALKQAIHLQEIAYEALEVATGALRNGSHVEPVDELEAACQKTDVPLKTMLHELRTSALCLSGGGIRSATFSLGVMEGLSRFTREAVGTDVGLMDGLDYLSTVSGGGYIGSWLMSWAYRRFHAGRSTDWRESYRGVVSALATQTQSRQDVPPPPPLTAGDPEPQPVRHLRSYTSYLAPALGLTLDTFTLVAIILRNLFVNWVMLLPLLFALISGARLLGLLLGWLERYLPGWCGDAPALHPLGYAVDILLAISFLAAAWAASTALPSHTENSRQTAAMQKGQLRKVRLFLSSVIFGSVLLAVSSGSIAHAKGWALVASGLIGLINFGLLSFSIWKADSSRMHTLGSMLRTKRGVVPSEGTLSGRSRSAAAAAVGTTLFAAALTSALLLVLRRYVFAFLATGGSLKLFHQTGLYAVPTDTLFVVLALPLVLVVLLLSTSLFCAMLGVFEQEEDREWWVRTGGALLALCVAWAVGQTLVFFGMHFSTAFGSG